MLKKIGPKSPFTNENCMSATKISLSFNLVKRSHYSTSQIFVQKFNFDKTPTISRVFHQIFFDNFSREIKVVNSKKVQNHNIFTSFSPKTTRQFSREIKVDFLDK